MKKIIERTLYVGLLLSLLALFGILAVFMAYPTLGLMKIAPVIGYIMVAVIEITLAVKTVREIREEGIGYAVAGVIYALAIVLL